MKISRFLANQFANPSGWFGKHVTSRLLNRANHQSNPKIFNALDIKTDDRFVEIGFGGGGLLFDVAATRKCACVCGVEKSVSMLERAQKRAEKSPQFRDIALLPGDVANLPLDNEYFNKVCSTNTIYFWDALDRGALEISRITAPGGKVVLGFTEGEVLKKAGYEERGFRFYDVEQVNTAMQNAALKLLHTENMRIESEGSFHINIYQKEL